MNHIVCKTIQTGMLSCSKKERVEIIFINDSFFYAVLLDLLSSFEGVTFS